MSLADELHKLAELHAAGALSAEEYAAAKAAVLAGGAAPPDTGGPAAEPVVHAMLEQAQRDAAVARVDSEWALERERHLVAGKYGQRHVPSRTLSVLGGVVVVGFGALWTFFAASMTGGGMFPLFGLLFIGVGIAVSVYGYIKAGAYEQAERRWRLRRRQALGQDPAERVFGPERDE